MKRGTELELDIEKFADRGKSLSRVDGFVVFVDGAVPGDRVRATVTRKKKNYAEARIDELLDPSGLRVEPKCRYFGTCGGCRWQHVDYDAQLAAKRASVEEALVHHGGFESVIVEATIGADPIYYYRNKMEFSFSAERWLTPDEIATGERFDTDFALGLHVPGTYHKVLDLQECHLQSELSAEIVNATRVFVKEAGWAPWHIRKHTGYLRHLVVRQAEHTDDLMLNLVTSGYDADRMAAYADFVRERFPAVTTLVNTVNEGVAQTAFGDEHHVVFGSGVIHEKIGERTFEIAHNAFFQTNTRQAEKLYDVAAEFADFSPDDLVYDLYAGAGTISLHVADRVRAVIGVELIEEAVENAKRNAAANGVRNCTFVAGDMLKLFGTEFVEAHGRPDVLIVDPPRAGMHPKVVRRIGEIRPERFVYVSCNPMTQARDLSALADAYAIDRVQPVDLFPHTHHVENVIRLTSRPS